MNHTRHLITDYAEMKTTNRTTRWDSHDAIATVRANIEREFPGLFQQEPRVFRLALNEAEALAWQTQYPHLVFPILAQEKVLAIAAWHERQTALRRQEPVLSFAA